MSPVELLLLIFIVSLNLSRPQRCAGTRCSCSLLHRAQMGAACVQLLLAATLWMMPHMGAAAVLSSSTELLNTTRAGTETRPDVRMLTEFISAPHSRCKRAISSREINALLDYHNRVRSQVFPPAANMEFMVRKYGTHDSLWFSFLRLLANTKCQVQYTHENTSIFTSNLC